jgi:hypothetical protein
VGGNQAGSQFLGGTGLGGGGGWYGGGGGYFNKANDAGGGGSGYIGNVNGASGGLGFTSSAAYANGTTYLGNIVTPQSNLPGGTNSPYYVSGYGHGNGGAGYVVIVPSVGTAATQIGVSAALFSG